MYEQACVFCLPSFAEGVPCVLMEAMAMELPVLSTRITGIPELIQDGSTGSLVTPGRADELADALQVLLRDPQRRRELGAAARRRVIRDFNSARCAEELYGLLSANIHAGIPPAGAVSQLR
jgi:glycosyltransferase involved in cell wall biosynthesis